MVVGGPNVFWMGDFRTDSDFLFLVGFGIIRASNAR